MKCTSKAPTRIFSIFLVAILIFTAFPISAFAYFDEPLSTVISDEWDGFGGLPEYEPDMPTDTTPPPDDNSPYIPRQTSGQEYEDSGDFSEKNNSTATPTNAPTAGTLGASGITIDLPDDVLADFIAFMNNAEKAIESPAFTMMPFAGVGDTGTISWNWGEAADFNAGGYYVNQIPSISLSTARPSEGRPFCAQFGPDPLQGGTYTAAAYSNPTILKLLVAHEKGNASAVGVQLAIWSITNNASAFATHPEAAAALSAANSVSTDGYTLLRWTTGGSYQPFFTLEKDIPTDNTPVLKILKLCDETGKLLKDAEFSVSGPGVNLTGLKTNNRGEILVNIPAPGGRFTITETTPPPGYFPASPASQTITINATNPVGTVTFRNIPDNPPPEEPEDSGFKVEVEVEVETDVEVRNEKEFEYSRAYGQFTLRKHDQDGKSLDGALFDIEVRFTDGSVLRENNWEVDNGARLFTYTHPENNHDAATITVTVLGVGSPV